MGGVFIPLTSEPRLTDCCRSSPATIGAALTSVTRSVILATPSANPSVPETTISNSSRNPPNDSLNATSVTLGVKDVFKMVVCLLKEVNRLIKFAQTIDLLRAWGHMD